MRRPIATARPRAAFGVLWSARWAWLLLLALAVYPSFATRFDQTLLATALTLALLAIVVDLQWGYSGIINFGPAVSLGLGAYAYTLMQKHVDAFDPTYLAFLAALFVPALVGGIVAFAAFRVGTIPIYFALITLSLAVVFERAIISAEQLRGGLTGVLGGSNGLLVTERPNFHVPSLVDYRIDSVTDFYPFVVGAVIVCYLISHFMTTSRFGRVLRAIRADEERVRTLGYNTLAHKVILISLSSAMGGLAGAIYAPLTGIAHPSHFGFLISVQAYVWVAVGGQGTLVGPLLAGVVLTVLQEKLRAVSTDAYIMIIAGLFIVAVVFLPRGLAGLLGDLGSQGRSIFMRRANVRQLLARRRERAVVR